MEHRGMSQIGVATINTTRANHAEWGLALFHYANLDRRGVCAQHRARFNIESIMHGTRRMVFGDIEGAEIMIIVLNLRAFSDAIPGRLEQSADTFDSQADRVHTTNTLPPARQGDIQRLSRQPGAERLLQQLLAAGVNGLGNLSFDQVYLLSSRGPLFSWQFPQTFQQFGNPPLLTEIINAQLFQRTLFAALVNQGQSLVTQCTGLSCRRHKSAFTVNSSS